MKPKGNGAGSVVIECLDLLPEVRGVSVPDIGKELVSPEVSAELSIITVLTGHSFRKVDDPIFFVDHLVMLALDAVGEKIHHIGIGVHEIQKFHSNLRVRTGRRHCEGVGAHDSSVGGVEKGRR